VKNHASKLVKKMGVSKKTLSELKAGKDYGKKD